MSDLIKKSKLFNMILFDMNQLHNLDDYAGLDKNALEFIKNRHTESDLKSLFSAIEYAANFSDYDFNSIMPFKQKHSNKDIYNCLCKLRSSLQKLGVYQANTKN